MNQGKILLVDDSPSIRTMLEDQLQAGGYTVHSAENGKRALDLLRQVTPDLVITDVAMPEMDGFGLCRWLRDHYQFHDVPIIILTAATEEKDACEGLGLGAADYIRKPFSPRELLLRVQNILTGALEKKRIREIFARHSSPEVMHELLSQTEDLMLAGETREIAVLFADIRGFTRMASGANPVELVKQLNRFLTVMTEAVIREFAARSRLKVTPDAGGSPDAVLHGTILQEVVAPLTYNTATQQSSSFLITVVASVKLTGRDGKTLYENPNYVFRQQYQSTTDLPTFLDESPAAVERLSRDFARALVADVMEGL